MITVEIIQADLVTLNVDAIAHIGRGVEPGGGVSVGGSLLEAAGPELRQECQGMASAECYAKGTSGCRLRARHIIHMVGSVQKPREAERHLAYCHMEILWAAKNSGHRSIAFPSLTFGTFHYPLLAAVRIAMETIHEQVTEYQILIPPRIVFVPFSEDERIVYDRLYAKIFRKELSDSIDGY